MSNKERVIIYDYIRVFATVLVVIGHASYLTMETKYGGISLPSEYNTTAQRLIDAFVRLIYSFHMPLYIALSGAVFALSHKKSFCETVVIKAKRLLLPFVICTIAWVVPVKAFVGYFHKSQNPLKDIIFGQLLLAGNTDMWFLWVLFVVTIISFLINLYWLFCTLGRYNL